MPGKPVITVQVRELVEFALRRGGLGGERDFVGTQRALAGTRGHQRLQRSRPEGYQKEIRLSFDVDSPECILRVQGRIDGLLVEGDEVLLEEIKTIQGRWDGEAAPLHWAQAKCYGYIHATQQGLTRLQIRLTYLELETDRVTEFLEIAERESLAEIFDQATGVYLEWVRERVRWCEHRDESIRAIAFPFPAYRLGQRRLAVAAYRSLARGERLFLEAPTGIGKTISVLFPAIKALGEGKLERVFYLTARTVGRVVAEKALGDLRAAGLRLRAVTLTAKEKICVRAGQPCDPATCPMAQAYYDRHKPAMRAALTREAITRSVLEEIGHEHEVCPFELSLDVSSWVDAVVCDYNYVFDPKVYLRRHFDAPGRCGFLIDEAHNLVERGREMFSADLCTQEIQEARRGLKAALPACARAFSRLSGAIRKLAGTAEAPERDEDEKREGELALWGAPGRPTLKAIADRNAMTGGGRRLAEFPESLLPLLDQALQQAEAWLTRNEPAEFRDVLLELFFRLHAFRRTAELYDSHYAVLVERHQGVRLKLFCLDPSFLLDKALDRGRAAIFFSATLSPLEYYRDLLGGRTQDPVLRLASPFPPQNLRVLIQPQIRTDFRARTESLSQVVQAITAVTAARAGNYLVYLPSYSYLNAVKEEFQRQHPVVQVLAQRPGMPEGERDNFLDAFHSDHRETLVGFAVMGGVFGEGIDLVGERLIGAIVVGVGLPQLCIERDLIRDYFQARLGAGFDYAYRFPGMNRVLQATGRVIRTETDRGVVLLIDTRFGEARYRALFPAWWQPVRASQRDLRDWVHSFWAAPLEKR